MPSTREVLVEARRLIEDPEKWAAQQPPYPRECAMTAVVHAGGRMEDVLDSAYSLLLKLAPATSLAAWNDTHSHAEVLDLFDRAIEAAS
jgi:hypothetical protein